MAKTARNYLQATKSVESCTQGCIYIDWDDSETITWEVDSMLFSGVAVLLEPQDPMSHHIYDWFCYTRFTKYRYTIKQGIM
jgi:hypothetical protein